jgi:hypothetical protein
MKANVLTLFRLFDRPIRLTVPIFQRGYVWSQANNWAPLWAELIETWQNSDEGSLFLGAIVLEQKLTQTGWADVRRVVDGQQRVTTIQVLFAAARELAGRLGATDLVARLKSLTTNSSGPDDVSETHKIWPGLADQDAYVSAMTGAVEAVPNVGDGPAIVRAYQFFAGELAKLVAERPDDAIAILTGFIAAVGNRVTVIVLDLDETDHPHVIFETLNARGTHLRQSDLVRNHIFHQLDRIGVPVDDGYVRHWAPFETAYWQERRPNSREGTVRLDEFLSDYLIMETERDLAPGRVFHDFRAYLGAGGRSLPAVMARVAEYGRHYASLDSLDGLSAEEAAVAAHIRDTHTYALRPVLMAILGRFSGPTRLSAMAVLESYLVRRYAIEASVASYGDIVPQLLRVLPEQFGPGPALARVLLSRTGESRWPTDQDVVKHLKTQRIYAKSPQRVLTILQVVEARLRRRGTEQAPYNSDELTIEHLMPRSPTPLPGRSRRPIRRQPTRSIGTGSRYWTRSATSPW